ncbi:tetratricopeptide repeat protein [Amycolatopsis sp. NPDC003731]
MPNLVQRAGRAIEVAQLSGTLNPGDHLVSGQYVMNVDSYPPVGRSPWGGMSGAALFCGGLLAGVITLDPAGRAHAALTAVPVSLLLSDPEFAAVVNAHNEVAETWCDAIELQPLAEALSTAGAESVQSPAGLLSPHRAVVPFRGRGAVLADLATWAYSPGIGAWLLHGPGGQGKTRLARRFGEQLTTEGWAVVWLNRAVEADRLRVFADTQVPVLVVVDYAESRTEQLATLATIVTGREGSVPVKILLLARAAGAWWQNLPALGEAMRDLAELTRVRSLDALDDDVQGRTATYQAAVAAFVAAGSMITGLDRTLWAEAAAKLADGALPEPDRNHTVLAVQMTALADLLDAAHTPQQATNDAGSPRGPEDRLLDHERGYWLTTARAYGLLPGLGLATLGDLVAATVLLNPSDIEDIGGVLALVPALVDQTRERREAARAWLIHLYPDSADSGFGGLTPDRLAERLIGRLLLDRTRPSVVDALASHVDKAQAEWLLTVCARAAAHAVFRTTVSDAVTELCLRHPNTLLIPAVDTATRVEKPVPLIRALEQTAANPNTSLADLERLLDAFPEHSLVLGDSAVTLGQEILARSRSTTLRGRAATDSALANHLNNLGFWLGEVGRQEEALAAITEAVEIGLRLTKWRRTAHLPTLAVSLNNLAVQLNERGRREEALTAIIETVKIYRRLAKRRHTADLRNLAGGLSNLATCLARLDHEEEALAAITETVDIRRRLSERQPDRYLPDLVGSLNNLAVFLREQGRWMEAFGAVAESVDLGRKLAEQRPDAYLPDLAVSLDNFSRQLDELGYEKEALDALVETVDIRRRLAERRPDVYLPDLAENLNNLAVRLSELGQRKEALPLIDEAVEAFRSLAEKQPEVYLPILSASLNNLGFQLGRLRRQDEALVALTEAVEISRKLAEQEPDAYLHQFVVNLGNLTILLDELDLKQKALAATTETVDIGRQLAEKQPDMHLPNLAWTLNSLAVRLAEMNRKEEAMAAITEAIEIRRQLTDQSAADYAEDLQQSLRVQTWLQEVLE